MFEAIGATLSNSVAIAISPMPIIAVILMLMSSRSKRLGLTFLLGWFIGVALAATVFTLLADVIPEADSGNSQPVIGTIKLVLGVVLLLLSVRRWRGRPRKGDEPKLPAWMSKIDTISVPATFAFAFALAALNPKNLLASASAGVVIGRAGLEISGIVVTVVIFSVIAMLTVLAPVLFAVVAPRTAATILADVREWMATNNATIMAVLLLVLGAKVIGDGIASF